MYVCMYVCMYLEYTHIKHILKHFMCLTFKLKSENVKHVLSSICIK